LIEHANGGVFRSDDQGETWTRASETNPRGQYYSQIVIDPNNDQRLWVAGAQMYYSEDGGRRSRATSCRRFTATTTPYGSIARLGSHDRRLDGGIYMSHDRGKTWDYLNNVAIGQFYEIGLDMQRPYRICGGLQDNNVWCGPRPRSIRTASPTPTVYGGGGDGFYAQFDPSDPSTVYGESQMATCCAAISDARIALDPAAGSRG